jgi:hypothetical protein
MRKKTVKNKTYYKVAHDSSNTTSVPELILHPLSNRNQKSLIVKSGDVLDVNYKELATLPTDNEDALADFMEKHAEYNPDTFFYMYK